MPYKYVYVPPEQLVDGTFLLRCNNYECRLDRDLIALNGLKFTELLKICQKIRVYSWCRGTKYMMIGQIKKIIVFKIPKKGDYVTNDVD